MSYPRPWQMDYDRIRYVAEHPDVDWEDNEVFWVFAEHGKMRIGGHRNIDEEKNRQIAAMVEKCCCGREGCPWARI